MRNSSFQAAFTQPLSFEDIKQQGEQDRYKKHRRHGKVEPRVTAFVSDIAGKVPEPPEQTEFVGDTGKQKQKTGSDQQVT
jgi:hypothetical protein